MDVQIHEIASTVRAVDGDALLTPQVMERIVRAVLLALETQQHHQERVREEQAVTSVRDRLNNKQGTR